MFIVKKKKGNEVYYYLRETNRINGKVVAKDIAYLGKNKKEAEEKVRKFEKVLKTREIQENNKEKSKMAKDKSD